MTKEATLTHPIVLPKIDWVPTKAESSRHGGRVHAVAIHRWGARYPASESSTYHGVINEFKNPANQASAHFVYPGVAVGGGYEITQMVPYAEKAWTESYFNPVCVEIESADAIWLGHDPLGFHLLARQAAYLLHHFHLEPQWITGQEIIHGKTGLCRHADLGSLGGGHTACPTTDIHLWSAFCNLTFHEYHRGGFRASWGR